VLCLQDTTELGFNGQSIAGLGPLFYEPQRGMYVHLTYAVTPDRDSVADGKGGRVEVSCLVAREEGAPEG
jgi:hypothetical protein